MTPAAEQPRCRVEGRNLHCQTELGDLTLSLRITLNMRAKMQALEAADTDDVDPEALVSLFDPEVAAVLRDLDIDELRDVLAAWAAAISDRFGVTPGESSGSAG